MHCYRFTSIYFTLHKGTSKTWFKPFDSAYQYARDQQKCLPFMTSFFCTRTPISKPTNWNEYTEYYCRIIHNDTSTQDQRKSATKMLAAVINKESLLLILQAADCKNIISYFTLAVLSHLFQNRDSKTASVKYEMIFLQSAACKIKMSNLTKNKDELIDNQIWRTISNVTKTQSERNLMLTVWVTKVSRSMSLSS